MRRLVFLACLGTALGSACGSLSAHDLGLKAGSLMVCAGGEQPVLAKLQDVDPSRAQPGKGPLIHTTLFTAQGQALPHAAIYSHYFMNCRLTSEDTAVPDGFEAAFTAWLAAGGSPVFNDEPAAVFAREVGQGRP